MMSFVIGGLLFCCAVSIAVVIASLMVAAEDR
jgi:hypothetical protein